MRYTFRYERRDLVGACIVFMRRPRLRRVRNLVLWLALTVAMIFVLAPERPGLALRAVLLGYLPPGLYLMLALLLATLWFGHVISGWLLAGPAFKRLAHAGREVYIDIDEHGVDGVDGGTPDLHTTLRWDAIKRGGGGDARAAGVHPVQPRGHGDAAPRRRRPSGRNCWRSSTGTDRSSTGARRR